MNKDRLFEFLLVLVAIVLGITLRVSLYSNEYPFNDGGMFFSIVQDLQNQECCSLPSHISYNNLSIPFMYPPLGFLLVSTLVSTFAIDIFDAFVYVPLFFSVATIPVFYIFVKNIAPKPVALLSTLLFSAYPRGFIWLIMGGGVTRAPGMLFALFSLYFFTKYSNPQKKLNIILSTIFAALCFLSHFEWAFFLATSLLVLTIFHKKFLLYRKDALLIIGTSTFFTCIWLVYQIINIGSISPLISFLGAGFTQAFFGAMLLLNLTYLTQEYMFPLVGVLGVVGLLYERKRNMWLSVWPLIPLILTPRTANNYLTIPFAIAASSILYRLFIDKKESITVPIFSNFIVVAVIYTLVGSFTLQSSPYVRDGAYTSITSEKVQSFSWINNNTAQESRFLVIPKHYEDTWSINPLAEWFPALSKRQSINTAQGTEWLPDDQFVHRVKFYGEILGCYFSKIECYEDVSNKYGYNYDYIYLERGVDDITRLSIANSKTYTSIYQSGNISIYKKFPSE